MYKRLLYRQVREGAQFFRYYCSKSKLALNRYDKTILFESYCHTIDYIFCDVHFFLSTIAP